MAEQNGLSCLYFVGIAGIGVSALAQIAQARGHRIVGADPGADPIQVPAIARLLEGGATIYRTHEAGNLPEDCELLIYTAAARNGNPEMEAAKERGIRVISRADYLGELMNSHSGLKIAVSGTHGKTTTTAMIGHLLKQTQPNLPTVFVGAEVAQLGGNLVIGSAETPFVAEACEAYDSFLSLSPDVFVITNIEADHLDHYKDEAGVDNAFCKFVYDNPRPGSRLVGCSDDPGVRRLIMEDWGKAGELPEQWIFSFEHEQGVDFWVKVLSEASPSRFIIDDFDTLQEYTLLLPGRHNIVNAVCAIIALYPLFPNVEGRKKLVTALATFTGAERRLETLADVNGITIIDDYAHHPTEIRATLAALRAAYPEKRLTVVFQPHLYSRTRDFLPQFAEELSKADRLIVTDIYPARELPIPGVTSEAIVTLARERNSSLQTDYVAEKFEVPALLLPTLTSGDLVVFMGAGSIREPGESLAAEIKAKNSLTSPLQEEKEHVRLNPFLASSLYKGKSGSENEEETMLSLSVCVLMGGFSAEREVSLSGGRQVMAALNRDRYQVSELDLRDLSDLLTLRENKPDLILPILHGRGGEDGVLQGLLDWMGLAYVGSGSLASSLAMNKVAAKDRFRQNGIPVIPGETVSRFEFTEGTAAELLTRLSCPLFVKPNAEGSTFGATLVHSSETLQEAIAFALNYDETALVETYIKGMEITCGVLEDPETGKPFALPLIEIVPKAEVYDYESKYAPGGSEHIIPARLSQKVTEQAQRIAVECHTLLGCRDLSRTDLIVREDELFVLETNTLPGMTPTSLLPEAAKAVGYSFSDLLDCLIQSALRRTSINANPK